MASPLESRVNDPYVDTLDLPSAFHLVPLRESGDAFAHAQAIAAKEGAGTLVWVGRFDVVEFALVLEPDEPLRSARRVIYAGLAALADALAVHAPPERPLFFDFPATVIFDGGLAGGAQLAWPVGAKENERPDWLVLGAMVRTHVMNGLEPGENPHLVGLAEEGFSELGAGRLVESFARHFMMYLDYWQNGEFNRIAESYIHRLQPAAEKVERSIDGIGDLLTRKTGKATVEKRKLLPAIERALWLDYKTGEILL